ncbi:VOC family protein [Actinokineospora pegani]|uniref:VOC family protein n=1 Tax=Actinokineospora pegani TaxID=2654637 RepID=UPI0012EA6E29|nr:VOC family protein [Actinokineospora pegani]
MAFDIDLTLDCAHPTALAAFYKLALGYEDEPPPPPFATRAEWVASFPPDPDDTADDGAWLRDPDGAGPRLCLQQVAEPKTGKIRLHLDIRVSRGVEPERRWAAVTESAQRLVAAGGSVLREVDEHHIVMADPEGNEFCLA